MTLFFSMTRTHIPPLKERKKERPPPRVGVFHPHPHPIRLCPFLLGGGGSFIPFMCLFSVLLAAVAAAVIARAAILAVGARLALTCLAFTRLRVCHCFTDFSFSFSCSQ